MDTLLLTTTPPPSQSACTLEGAHVSPATATIVMADTLRLHASFNTCVDPTGAATFTWKSSDTLVASVDSSGLVRGLSKGTATIIASDRRTATVQGAAAITVVAP